MRNISDYRPGALVRRSALRGPSDPGELRARRALLRDNGRNSARGSGERPGHILTLAHPKLSPATSARTTDGASRGHYSRSCNTCDRKSLQLGVSLMATTFVSNIMKLRFVSAFVLASALLLAQRPGPGGPPNSADMVQRHVEMLSEHLSLTAAQKQQATTILTDSESSQVTLRQSLRSAHEALNAAIQKNDANGIEAASAQVGSLTGQMTASQARAHAALFQTLTPDQQTQFKSMPMGMGPGMGRGGPGGPGGAGAMRRQKQSQ